jgi:hypothetical protein
MLIEEITILRKVCGPVTYQGIERTRNKEPSNLYKTPYQVAHIRRRLMWLGIVIRMDKDKADKISERNL